MLMVHQVSGREEVEEDKKKKEPLRAQEVGVDIHVKEDQEEGGQEMMMKMMILTPTVNLSSCTNMVKTPLVCHQEVFESHHLMMETLVTMVVMNVLELFLDQDLSQDPLTQRHLDLGQDLSQDQKEQSQKGEQNQNCRSCSIKILLL